MNDIADEFFKTFTDAGLRVGMTIRPQDLVVTTNSDGQVTGATQVDVPPDQVLTLLENKIQYAVNRWGASLFYIDSDVYSASAINTLGLTTGGGFPVYIFQQLQERFPNVLIIPELSGVGDHAYTAGYLQLASTSAAVHSTYPDAFGFDAGLGSLDSEQLARQPLSQWVQAVQAGDILSYWGAGDSVGNQFIREVYSQAYPSASPVTSAATALPVGAAIPATGLTPTSPSATLLPGAAGPFAALAADAGILAPNPTSDLWALDFTLAGNSQWIGDPGDNLLDGNL